MWPNQQEPADLVTFTEEILNGKLYFLCSEVIEEIDCSAYSEESNSEIAMLSILLLSHIWSTHGALLPFVYVLVACLSDK